MPISEITVGIIGIILSAMGISVAIFYNARSIRQNTMSHYYDVIKNLNEQYNEIETNIRINERKNYIFRTVNFHYHLNDLAHNGIIPEKILLGMFKNSFSNTLYYLKKEYITSPFKDEFIRWCEQRGIKEKLPSFVSETNLGGSSTPV